MPSASKRTIQHSLYATALKRIQRIHKTHEWPARPENLRMYGASGVGKSTVLRAYRDMHPPQIGANRTIIPVLYCIVPPMPTVKLLVTELLRAMGAVYPDRGTAASQISRFLELCRQCLVELLLIDEAHHFVDRGSLRTHMAVADLLKVLFEKLERPAVMAGAPRMVSLFTINNQLRRRFSASYTLRPFDLTALFPDFRGFVHGLGKDFQPSNRNWLAQAEVARLLFYATDGIPSNVVDLMRRLEEIDTAKKSLSLSDLSQSFRESIWEFPTAGSDPFLSDFRQSRLNRVGEPFEPSLLDGDNHDGMWGHRKGGPDA